MRAILRVLIISTVGVVPATRAAPPAKNVTTVVIADGPFAGSYTADNAACLHVKDRDLFGSGWKAFSDHPKTRTLEEAGIEVDRVSEPGAKKGDIVVKLADGVSEKLHDYSMSNVPLTLTRSGKGGVITFEGKTKDGVRLRISATCVDVEEF